MKTKARSYQEKDLTLAYEVIKNNGFVAWFYKPGRGKTFVSLSINERLFADGLSNALFVVCPSNATKVWREQIVRHSELPDSWWEWDSTKSNSKSYISELRSYLTYNKYPIFILSIQSLQRYNENLMNTIFSFVKNKNVNLIVDESGKFKNPTAKRTQRLFDFSTDAKYRSILNGTPTPRSICDIWAQMEILKKGFWKEKSYSTFEYIHSVKIFVRSWDGKKGYEKTIGWNDVEDMKEKLSNLNMVSFPSEKQQTYKVKLESEIENLTIQLKRVDGLMRGVQDQIDPYVFYADRDPDVPAVTHQNIYFDLSKKEREVYKKIKNDLTFIADDGEVITMKSRASLFHKFRQITGGSFSREHGIEDIPSKLEALIDDLETHEENCLIITTYVRNVEIIARELGKIGPTMTYYGDQHYGSKQDAIKHKDEVVNNARNGKLKFIVANSASIAMSVDGLQESFSMLYTYDIPLDPQDWGQVIFRLDRLGQKKPVVVRHLLANNSIDERCLSLANEKKNIQSAFESMSDEEFEKAI